MKRLKGTTFVLAVIVSIGCLPLEVASADEIRRAQWHLSFLQVLAAHRISSGQGVTVAVIDTGVDASHSDFGNAIAAGTNFAPSGDGRQDADGHGTAVAGLIAARGRGPAGALGIAPTSTILPINAGGFGKASLAEAIEWAIEHDASVICIAQVTGDSDRLRAAIARALERNVVVVAGAGNKPSVGVQAPAKYAGAVAAVGVDRNGEHAEISVTGPEAGLAAPAVDVVSTGRNGSYRKGTGTSDATAIIAGAAALVRAKYPNLSAREVIHRLTYTAIDKGKPGRDEEYGYGIVDLVAALTADVPPMTQSPSPRASAPSSNAASPSGQGDGGSLVGWIVGGVLLAAAGVGVVLALHRATAAR